jgi:hypothetical protein
VRTTQSVRGQVVYTTYLRHAGGVADGLLPCTLAKLRQVGLMMRGIGARWE